MEQHRCMGCMSTTENAVCEKCGWPMNKNNEPHQLPAGYVLRGQYIIGRVLGQGGFGITYLGWDSYLDIPVAIKEFYPNSMVNRECSMTTRVHCYTEQVTAQYVMSKERFLREAKALARFEDEPAIVRIRNFFEENETAYIVMEYVRGTNLATYVDMRGGKLSPEETLRILKPVMEALAVIHEADLVHRDISPDNIMLHPRGGAKLLDFGAVRSVEKAEAGRNLAHSTEAILKHGFAPMEQYQSRGGLGPWTDEYALCATIYYCLTGKIPEEAPRRMLEEIDLDWDIPGLAAHQQEALRKGVALRARDRFGTIRELMDALYNVPQPVSEELPQMPAPKLPKKKPENIPEIPKSKPEKVPEPPKPEKVSKPPKKEKTSETQNKKKVTWLIPVVAVAVIAAALTVSFVLIPNGWRAQGNTYYYYSMGKKIADSWHQEGSAWYYFDSDGRMVKRWQKIDGTTRFFGSDGVMVYGWQDINGGRYYFGEDGIMVTGPRIIGEEAYGFWENGAMIIGWAEIGDSIYFFGPDGAAPKGWKNMEGHRYYFNDNGSAAVGWLEKDNEMFYFDEKGRMVTGFEMIGGSRYYFDRRGVMATGWKTIGASRCYFGEDGIIYTGRALVDGVWYDFGYDGDLTTPE